MKFELQNVGKLLMIGLDSVSLSKSETAFLKMVKPTGVVYFKRNIENEKQTKSLSQQIQKLLGNKAWIAIDQEGGRVARLPSPDFTKFPTMFSVGEANKKLETLELTRWVARAISEEIRRVGVNMNFGPVADIHTNPKNPVIGDRAFGKDAMWVAYNVMAMIDTYYHEGIISCAKHFPGHGDTHLDSHLALPKVSTSKSTLNKRELIPFFGAIAANVPTIMTAHVIYKNLDPKHTATMSKTILQGLLRKKMKYEGVIISDDLEMNAVANHYTPLESAIACLEAGVDLMLVCKSLDKSMEIVEGLAKAIIKKEVPVSRLNQSVSRIARVTHHFQSAWRDASRVPQQSKKMHEEVVHIIERVASL